MTIATLGFLDIQCFENGAATRGAILVTAMDTKPLEFRYTAPVRPQSVQKMLFGELLNEHIVVDLIGLPLINALETKPDLILVRDDILLGISSKQEIPMIRMIREGEPLPKKKVAVESLESPDGSDYASIKLYTNEKFAGALPQITEQLQQLFLQRDLMEPFERVKNACTDAHKREVA